MGKNPGYSDGMTFLDYIKLVWGVDLTFVGDPGWRVEDRTAKTH